MKKIISFLLVFSLIICTNIFFAHAIEDYSDFENRWSSIKESDGYIILTPGSDISKMNFSWQSPFISNKGKIIIGQSSDLSDGKYLEVTRSLCIFGFEWTNEATVENLKENTEYYYKYYSNNVESKIFSFVTGSSDSTKVAFITDSQIGRYHGSDDQDENYKHDTYGWTTTLETILENNDNINFFISSGDQVEDSYSEEQYSMFESPDVLRSYPIAATVGNHDFYTDNFKYHFNVPNDNTFVPARWPGSNGYYYCYNDVLFVFLDSNNIVPLTFYNIISKAVKTYPNAKWRVAVMHHSAYDANSDDDFSNKMQRSTVVPYFDKFEFDLVLSGHDHFYSRSYIIKDNKVTDDTAADNTYTNPDGTLYISGNSSSGSNFSGIDFDSISKYCDVYSQNRIPTYSIVEFSGDNLIITTYETIDNNIIDSVKIIKS